MENIKQKMGMQRVQPNLASQNDGFQEKKLLFNISTLT